MSTKTLIASFAMAGLLALAPLASQADDAPPPNMPQGKAWCKDNPEKCADMRQKREEWCKNNAAECDKMKAKAAERQEWCKKNPAECQKQREERRQRMQDMKAKCDADPAKCEERRKEMRERWQQKQGDTAGKTQP
ncbi:MAG: hypothetical protein IT484_10240 [Gammaproteobacteria bacterium]|nr:hypothetical protein [Gammaproteobacteria bacterium]